MSGLVHPDQNVRNATQNSLCRAVNRRRGCCACRASNCRRRARFSEDEVLAGRKTPHHPTEEISERSDHSLESYRKSPNRALRQVIHLQVYRAFGEAHPKNSKRTDRCNSGRSRLVP